MGVYYMKIKLRRTNFFYIISLIYIFVNSYSSGGVNSIIGYLIMMIWSIRLCLYYENARNPVTRNNLNKVIKQLRYFIAPYLGMGLYTFILWVFQNDIAWVNYTRLASTIIYYILGVGFVACGWMIFQERLCDMIFVTGAFVYATVFVIPDIVSSGLIGFFKYVFIMNIQLKGSANQFITLGRPLEIHDLTFAYGLIFLYYLLYENKQAKYHKTKLIVSALIIVIGLKSIEVLAILISVLTYILFLKSKKLLKYKSCIIMIAIIVLSYVFIYIIDRGIIVDIAHKYNITSNRLDFYKFSTNFFDFDVFFSGLGFTKFSRYFGELYASGFRINGYRVAASIHSDILTQYISLGFFGFALWIFYYFYIIPKKTKSNIGKYSANGYLLAVVYMFIVYFTDNTLTYTLTQMCFFMFPLATINVNENSYIYKKEKLLSMKENEN